MAGPSHRLARLLHKPNNDNGRSLGVADGNARLVRQKVLLGDVGDVFGLVVFGEQVVEGLVLARADTDGDRLVPFLGIVEFRIDVEDHAAKRKQPVADDLADEIAGGLH